MRDEDDNKNLIMMKAEKNCLQFGRKMKQQNSAILYELEDYWISGC